MLPLLSLWRPLGLPISSLHMSSWAQFLGSVPQDSPFLSPLHIRASTGSTLKQHLFMRHTLKFLFKYNIHTKESIHAVFVSWMNLHILTQQMTNTPEVPLTPPSYHQHPTETAIFTFDNLD